MIEAKPCLKMDSCTKDTVIMDKQDARFPSFPLGGGINELSMSQREAFQFVNSGSNDVHKGGLGDLTQHNSKIIIDPFGGVLITDTGVEMRDLLSIVTEFYLSNGPISSRKISMPIPYYMKSFRKGRNNTNGSGGKLKAAVVAPTKRNRRYRTRTRPLCGM